MCDVFECSKSSEQQGFLDNDKFAFFRWNLCPIYVQDDQWNFYILFTQEIKTSIIDFSFFKKGSFIQIIT